jgi:hypothetical protein
MNPFCLVYIPKFQKKVPPPPSGSRSKTSKYAADGASTFRKNLLIQYYRKVSQPRNQVKRSGKQSSVQCFPGVLFDPQNEGCTCTRNVNMSINFTTAVYSIPFNKNIFTVTAGRTSNPVYMLIEY